MRRLRPGQCRSVNVTVGFSRLLFCKIPRCVSGHSGFANYTYVYEEINLCETINLVFYFNSNIIIIVYQYKHLHFPDFQFDRRNVSTMAVFKNLQVYFHQNLKINRLFVQNLRPLRFEMYNYYLFKYSDGNNGAIYCNGNDISIKMTLRTNIRIVSRYKLCDSPSDSNGAMSQ